MSAILFSLFEYRRLKIYPRFMISDVSLVKDYSSAIGLMSTNLFSLDEYHRIKITLNLT